jgi:hypothetical protein
MNTTAKIILAFITLLIGINLLTTAAQQGLERTSLVTLTGESVDISAARNIDGRSLNSSVVLYVDKNDWTNEDCQMTDVVVGNSTGSTFTDGTDYNFTESTGAFVLYNTTTTYADTTNTSEVTYTYCPEGYMNLGWGRTAILIIPGFFAIALLIVSVGLFYSIYKEWDE